MITNASSCYSNTLKNSDAFLQPLKEVEEIYQKHDRFTDQEKPVAIEKLSTVYKSLIQNCKDSDYTPVKGENLLKQNTTVLSEAKGAIPEQLKAVAARVFFLYGQAIYGGDMSATKTMFQTSLAFQLAHLNALDESALPQLTAESLQELPKALNGATVFDKVDSYDTNSEEFVKLARSHSDQEAFDTAKILRWLGAPYQNLDQYQTSDSLTVYEKTYSAAEKIFKELLETSEDNKIKADSNFALAELYYNTAPFMYGLKNTNVLPAKSAEEAKKLTTILTSLITKSAEFFDEQGISDFEKNKRVLRTLTLQAQIHNRTSQHTLSIAQSLNKIGLSSDASNYWSRGLNELKEAIKISNMLEEFDPFLKNMFVKRYAGVCFHLIKAGNKEISLNEIDKIFDEQIAKCQKNKNNHYYYAEYFTTAAQVKMYQNQLETAENYLDEALTICNKFPDSTAGDRNIIGLLKNEIAKAKKFNAEANSKEEKIA